MNNRFSLPQLLRRYIDGLDDLNPIREYVTERVGAVDDELIDYVSMEIWYLEDGYVTEERLRSRLFEILEDSQIHIFSFGAERPGISSVQTSSSSIDSVNRAPWSLDNRPALIRGAHTFA